MKSILTIFLVLLASSCATRRSCELAHSHSDPQQVKQALRSITIPHVAMQKASVHDAVDFLSTSSVENDSRGVSLVLSLSSAVSTPSISEDPFADAPVYAGPHITISDRSMTYLELLNEICRQADLVWRITPKCLVITKNKE